MESARTQPSAPGRSFDNLPLELTSFVGRDREVAEVKGLLADRRLLTLCGSGGSGKTRLALAVAQDVVEEFDGGVWWVELAPLSDPGLVVRAVAQTWGAKGQAIADGRSGESKADEDALDLDNCENLSRMARWRKPAEDIPEGREPGDQPEPLRYPASLAGRCQASPCRMPMICLLPES